MLIKSIVKTKRLYLLSLFSGLLLTFAWFPHGWTPLIFIGLVPLLLAEKRIYHSSGKYRAFILFVCAYLTFITWNILTTWWVKNASYGGAALAIICNSLVMTLVFLLYHKVKKEVGEKWQYLIFCSFWITWEYLHMFWDLSWTWLTLGNAFADNRSWIQWYEYTGTFGGTLWVLITNCLVASCFFVNADTIKFKSNGRKVLVFITVIVSPLLVSSLISANFSSQSTDKEKYVDVVVVQPNIDPYNEKFSGTGDDQLKKMLALASQKVDSNTAYLLFPETALVDEIWEDEWSQAPNIQQLTAFLKSYPRLKIIIGACTSKEYKKNEKRSATARKFTQAEGYYDSYNTALQLDSTKKIQVYHKSKLVPGVEKMPFPFIFKHLDNIAIDLGGTVGSLGMQEERTVFVSPDHQSKAAPVICYESIYGDYVSEYIRNGANFIAIITNDGWWGDTPGYRQHLKYGALRAIETRHWVARSANTGTSCFINPKGEILQTTDWWVPAVIKQKIELRTELTFYTLYGDYIAKMALYISVSFIIYTLVKRLKIVRNNLIRNKPIAKEPPRAHS